MNKLDQIRLIAVDVDDTLITARGAIPPRVIRAISDAHAVGVTVTLATGRTYILAEPFARTLQMSAPLITNNGALIRDLSGKCYHHWPIPSKCVAEIARMGNVRGASLLLFVDDMLYAAHDNEPIQYYTGLGGIPATFVGDLESFAHDTRCRENVSNALLIGRDPEEVASLIPELQKAYAGQLEVSRSKPRLIELTAAGVSKGKALQRLAEQMGLNAAQVMAIGDSFNDLEMLRYAGVSVAVANAPPEIQAAADFVVASNEAGGVADAIDKVTQAAPPQPN